MIVVNASVVAKWYLAEPRFDAAAGLLNGRFVLIAPEIIAVEVASAISRRLQTGQLSGTDALRLLSAWTASLEDLIRLEPWRVGLEDAGRLASELRHVIADCLCLATAMRQGLPSLRLTGPFRPVPLRSGARRGCSEPVRATVRRMPDGGRRPVGHAPADAIEHPSDRPPVGRP